MASRLTRTFTSSARKYAYVASRTALGVAAGGVSAAAATVSGLATHHVVTSPLSGVLEKALGIASIGVPGAAGMAFMATAAYVALSSAYKAATQGAIAPAPEYKGSSYLALSALAPARKRTGNAGGVTSHLATRQAVAATIINPPSVF